MADASGGPTDRDYEVGYGKPPRHSRFPAGQSGNRRGRPKGARSFATIARNVLQIPVPVTENGRTRRVSTQEAALLRLREKALKGDAKAMDRLLALAQQYGGEATHPGDDASREEDARILDHYRQRLRKDGAP